jgi:hypothetical protein
MQWLERKLVQAQFMLRSPPTPQNNANNARMGNFSQHHHDTFEAMAEQDGHLETLLV